MAGAFVFGVARFEVVAMIRGEEDDAVLQHIQADQRVDQPAKRLVQPLDHAEVTGQLLMAGAAERRQVRRNPATAIAFGISGRRRKITAVVLMVRLDVGQE